MALQYRHFLDKQRPRPHNTPKPSQCCLSQYCMIHNMNWNPKNLMFREYECWTKAIGDTVVYLFLPHSSYTCASDESDEIFPFVPVFFCAVYQLGRLNLKYRDEMYFYPLWLNHHFNMSPYDQFLYFSCMSWHMLSLGVTIVLVSPVSQGTTIHVR